jgi:hypothetical protein
MDDALNLAKAGLLDYETALRQGGQTWGQTFSRPLAFQPGLPVSLKGQSYKICYGLFMYS